MRAKLISLAVLLALLTGVAAAPKKRPKSPGTWNPNPTLTGPITVDQGLPGALPWLVTAAQGAAGVAAWKVDGSGVTQPVSGTFWPASQPVSGTITANAGTGTFTVSGTVTANAGTGTLATSSLQLPAALVGGRLSIDGSGVTQPVSGAVSVSSGTVAATQSGAWTLGVNNFPATQPISGTVTANQGGTWTVQPGNTANTTAWKVDGSAVTQPVSGVFWQATQPVSGTVTANQGGTWTVQPGNTANTTAWKVDGSAVTQPVSGTVTANTGTLPALTKGTQGATGFSTQDLKDAGRSSVMITAEAVAGSASEALVTMTWSAGGAVTTTGTSYPVTAGKKLRLQSLTVTFVSTTTTANTARIRVRENAGGAAIITSPIQFSARVGWPSATFIANEGVTVNVPIPDGFELPAGAGLAISHIEAAANGTIDLSAVGYEY